LYNLQLDDATGTDFENSQYKFQAIKKEKASSMNNNYFKMSPLPGEFCFVPSEQIELFL